jgi:hypothetical protein
MDDDTMTALVEAEGALDQRIVEFDCQTKADVDAKVVFAMQLNALEGSDHPLVTVLLRRAADDLDKLLRLEWLAAIAAEKANA